MAEKAVGITSLGVYLPRRRLSRSALVEAHLWANPNLKALAKGSRTFANADEDTITLAVAATRAALLSEQDRARVGALFFASTTHPFADRQNATIVAEAVRLNEALHTADLGGSQRAGTMALLQALYSGQNGLVVAADTPPTKPASVAEFMSGDGAVALTTGVDDILAQFVCAHSISSDLIDHYRASDATFDYSLEERWVKEEGHLKLIPKAVIEVLGKAKLEASQIKHLIVPGLHSRTAQGVAKACGIDVDAVHSDLQSQSGYIGCAHALMSLADALQKADPGDYILATGFGQGCDALIFQCTDNIHRARAFCGPHQALEKGVVDDNYLRFLSFKNLIQLDWGIRAERDTRTALSALYRQRETITAFVGGRCTRCDTVQFPKTRLCVNPDCHTENSQVSESFAEKTGYVKSLTEDWLAVSPSPPLMYGNIRFENKGLLMMEFTDFSPNQIEVGTAMEMVFRIKDRDERRHFRRYFWKAAPLL